MEQQREDTLEARAQQQQQRGASRPRPPARPPTRARARMLLDFPGSDSRSAHTGSPVAEEEAPARRKRLLDRALALSVDQSFEIRVRRRSGTRAPSPSSVTDLARALSSQPELGASLQLAGGGAGGHAPQRRLPGGGGWLPGVEARPNDSILLALCGARS